MKRFFGLCFVFALCAGFILSCAGTLGKEKAPEYKPGTYTGQSRGNNGNITVHVTLAKNRIARIEVDPCFETPSLAKTPLERIPRQIIEYQSLKVDTVTGATVTSMGVISAVEKALKEAGADLNALRRAAIPKVDRSKETVKKSADVVVVGGGGAGLSAALAVTRKGGNVILIEKTASLGGNTILAGGGYNAADPLRTKYNKMTDGLLAIVRKHANEPSRNDLHKALQAQVRQQLAEYEKTGVKTLFDTPEFHALQTWAAGDYEAKLDLVYNLTQKTAASIGYIEEIGGAWRDAPITYVGALYPRSHEIKDAKSGQGFIDVFLRRIERDKSPIEIIYETRAFDFIKTGDRITGVKATGPGGLNYEISAKGGVVLATGGFGANVAMRQKYNTQWPTLDHTVKTTNVSTITGDGIIMAEAAGAKLIQMNYIQLLVSDPQNGNSSGYVGQAAGLLVNQEGSRFINELSRRDELMKGIMKQTGGICYIIAGGKNANLDEKGLNKYGQHIDDLIDMGKVFIGNTPEELAQKAKIPPAVMKKTIDDWNAMCRSGVDTQFGRASFEDVVTIFEGPYYASPRQPSVHHTMGGLEVDVDCRVQSARGGILPGLYAAGEVTGGIHGTNRVGANAIPDAIVNGKAAGENAYMLK